MYFVASLRQLAEFCDFCNEMTCYRMDKIYAVNNDRI